MIKKQPVAPIGVELKKYYDVWESPRGRDRGLIGCIYSNFCAQMRLSN